jgi:uncharacterized protein
MRLRILLLLLSPIFAQAAAQISEPHTAGGWENPRQNRSITCEQMKKAPQDAFSPNVDLGSGSGSPTEVDWRCPGGLQSLSFLEPLAALAEEIRGEELAQPCTGTIVHALWRYYQFDLLAWGLAPEIALEQMHERHRRGSILRPGRPDAETYLEAWSFAHYSNFVLYQRYREALAKARPLLIRHYIDMGYTDVRAAEFADQALLVYADRAGGAFPSSGVPVIVRSLDIVAMLRNASDAEDFIKTIDAAEARAALNSALLLRKPPKFVSVLLDHIDDLGAQDESPLVYAIGNRKLMELLLERGADVNHRNPFGKTPLFYVIETDDTQSVELLINHGADVKQKYAGGSDAEEFGCTYAVRGGRTVLMHAAQHAGSGMLQLLLKRGAPLMAVDSEGNSATDYAFFGEKDENIAFLKSRGLRSNHAELQRDQSKCLQDAKPDSLGAEELQKVFARCFAAPAQ